MLLLLVPGVGMGGTSIGGAGGGGSMSHLMMMGVGRMWWLPFILAIGAYRG